MEVLLRRSDPKDTFCIYHEMSGFVYTIITKLSDSRIKIRPKDTDITKLYQIRKITNARPWKVWVFNSITFLQNGIFQDNFCWINVCIFCITIYIRKIFFHMFCYISYMNDIQKISVMFFVPVRRCILNLQQIFLQMWQSVFSPVLFIYFGEFKCLF